MDFSRWVEAETLQRRFIAASRQAGVAARAQLAEILLHEGKLDESYRAMLDCLAEAPYNYEAHLNLGKLLARQKKWQEARPHLEFVKRYFPDQDADTYRLLIQADRALGEPAAATEAARFGLRMFPDNADLKALNLLQPKTSLWSRLK